MNEPDRRILKSSFEDCLDSQERLRAIITKLASENRCLVASEQEEFFREMAHSTFGMGRNAPFKVYIEKDIFSLHDVEYASRFISTRTSNKVSIPNEYGTDPSPPVDISVLWERLLLLLFGVFPIALDRSSAMSKEKDNTTGGGSGYDFTP